MHYWHLLPINLWDAKILVGHKWSKMRSFFRFPFIDAKSEIVYTCVKYIHEVAQLHKRQRLKAIHDMP